MTYDQVLTPIPYVPFIANPSELLVNSTSKRNISTPNLATRHINIPMHSILICCSKAMRHVCYIAILDIEIRAMYNATNATMSMRMRMNIVMRGTDSYALRKRSSDE